MPIVHSKASKFFVAKYVKILFFNGFITAFFMPIIFLALAVVLRRDLDPNYIVIPFLRNWMDYPQRPADYRIWFVTWTFSYQIVLLAQIALMAIKVLSAIIYLDVESRAANLMWAAGGRAKSLFFVTILCLPPPYLMTQPFTYEKTGLLRHLFLYEYPTFLAVITLFTGTAMSFAVLVYLSLIIDSGQRIFKKAIEWKRRVREPYSRGEKND